VIYLFGFLELLNCEAKKLRLRADCICKERTYGNFVEKGLTYAARGAAAFLIAATVLPFFKSRHWAVRAFDFPRLQIAFAAGLWCTGALARWPRLERGDKRLLGVTAAALATQLLQIRPYTRLARREVMSGKGNSDLSILTANVLQQNRRTEVYRELISEWQPDVILLTETDEWWAKEMQYLKEMYPFVVECPLNNTYGMILYSRLELLNPEVRFLVKDEIPSIKTRVRLRNGGAMWLYAVHPEPPASRKPDKTPRGSGPRDVELLLLAEELERMNEPTVVVGDFNDVAWSHTTRLFKRLSRLLDPRRGRGMFNTFHADYPVFRYPLDHLFHSEHMVLVDFHRGPYTGSDHFPIFAALQLAPEAAEVQEQDVPSRGDEKEAEKVIHTAETD
jgi:endonuclease/exonuclease/phosphatase (EEP) superfamily protein YafD